MKRNIILSYIFTIFFWFQIDIGLWTIYLTDKKGLSLINLGIFQVILVTSRFLLEIPSGVLSDRFGRVRTLIISSFTLLLSNILILFGHTSLVISLAYVFFGISMAFCSGTFESFLYDTLKSENKENTYTNVYTSQYAAAIFSMAAAMAVGGYLSNINMDYMYVGNIISFTIALIATFLMKEPPFSNSEQNTVRKIINDSITTIKTSRKLLYLIAFITIIDAASNTTWHLSQKLLSQLGMTNIQISGEAIFTTLVCALAAKSIYFIEKKLGKMGSSFFIASLLSLPLIILGLSKNTFIMLPALTLTTITVSFARPIFSTYINDEVESSFRATTLSIESLLTSVFTLVFVAALGLTNNIGYSFVVVGFLTIPVFLYILLKIKNCQNDVENQQTKKVSAL